MISRDCATSWPCYRDCTQDYSKANYNVVSEDKDCSMISRDCGTSWPYYRDCAQDYSNDCSKATFKVFLKDKDWCNISNYLK